MHTVIVLEPVSQHNFDDLTVLLTCDEALLQSLNPKQRSGTANPNELFEDIVKWQTDNQASSYAIRLDNKSIGLIASAEWNKGYGTEAFVQIIEIAKRRGFTQLSASINPSNQASKRIWENFGARFGIQDDGLVALLKI